MRFIFKYFRNRLVDYSDTETSSISDAELDDIVRAIEVHFENPSAEAINLGVGNDDDLVGYFFHVTDDESEFSYLTFDDLINCGDCSFDETALSSDVALTEQPVELCSSTDDVGTPIDETTSDQPSVAVVNDAVNQFPVRLPAPPPSINAQIQPLDQTLLDGLFRIHRTLRELWLPANQ